MIFVPSIALKTLLGITIFLPTLAIAAPTKAISATAANSPLEKRVWLSNIDVQEACNQQYGDGVVRFRPTFVQTYT
ncbi:hypothetical protein QBC41DRAFT_383283, partial [Cercophora samala]